MKILFVGHLDEGQTSRMRMEALERLGHSVLGLNEQREWARARWLSAKWQHRTQHGPVIRRWNRAVLEAARTWRPELVWAEKQEHLRASTLGELRRSGARLLHFTPDPYFTLRWKRTRTMDDALPHFDYLVTCKRYEVEHYRRIGPQVIYMPLGFAEWVHRPTAKSASSSDVAFVGGWEPRREDLLEAVATTGCDLKVWGYAWDHLVDGRWTVRRAYRLRRNAGGMSYAIRRSEPIARALQGGEIYGEAYAAALSGAKIGVGFLRRICPDQHTTRTFEIPACRSMMLADRTEEHQEFFEEGHEAEFFSTAEELTDKVRFYLKHDAARREIARRGFERCATSGYSYRHRVQSVLDAMQ